MNKILTILLIAMCGICMSAPTRSAVAARATTYSYEDSIPYAFELEYLTMQSPSQFVDTLVLPSSYVEVEFKVATSGSSKWRQCGLFGNYQYNGDKNFCCVRDFDGYIRFYLGSSSKPFVVSSPFNIKISAFDCYCEVNKQSWNGTPLSSFYSKSLLIGSRGYSGDSWDGIQKWYYCKIWENGELIRDFIPVVDSNSVVCFFDRVTQRRFYNAGSGNFNGGPVIENE